MEKIAGKTLDVIVWHDNGTRGQYGGSYDVIRPGETVDSLIRDYADAGITVYAVELLEDYAQ